MNESDSQACCADFQAFSRVDVEFERAFMMIFAPEVAVDVSASACRWDRDLLTNAGRCRGLGGKHRRKKQSRIVLEHGDGL